MQTDEESDTVFFFLVTIVSWCMHLKSASF